MARRVKEVRKRRGWNTRRLAEECAAVGATWLTDNVIENIEGARRRDITVDELLVFAYVLDVAPVHLLVPTTETQYQYVPREKVSEETGAYPAAIASRVREWIRGNREMPATDVRLYYSEVPAEEFGDRRGQGGQHGD